MSARREGGESGEAGLGTGGQGWRSEGGGTIGGRARVALTVRLPVRLPGYPATPPGDPAIRRYGDPPGPWAV